MSFGSGVSSFVDDTQKEIVEHAKGMARILFIKVVNRTPVDSGLLKGAWVVGLNSPNESLINNPDKSGTRVISDIMQQISKWDGKDKIFLTNSQPHAVPCEYGHSEQAPAGMVRVSLAEMQ